MGVLSVAVLQSPCLLMCGVGLHLAASWVEIWRLGLALQHVTCATSVHCLLQQLFAATRQHFFWFCALCRRKAANGMAGCTAVCTSNACGGEPPRGSLGRRAARVCVCVCSAAAPCSSCVMMHLLLLCVGNSAAPLDTRTLREALPCCAGSGGPPVCLVRCASCM